MGASSVKKGTMMPIPTDANSTKPDCIFCSSSDHWSADCPEAGGAAS